MFYEYTAKLFLSLESVQYRRIQLDRKVVSIVLSYELCLYEVWHLCYSLLWPSLILDCLYATHIHVLIEDTTISLLAYEIFILKQLPKGPVVKACDHALQLYIEFQLGRRMVDET